MIYIYTIKYTQNTKLSFKKNASNTNWRLIKGEIQMNVTKIIKFYQFEPLPSLFNNGLSTIRTIDLLKNVFPKCASYDISFDKDKYIIDIIEIGEDFIFGTCAKENELGYTNFYQMRDKHTNKTKPYSSVSPDTQLEVYTFFYIDCTQNRMAVIQHKSIAQIHSVLSKGIWSLSGNRLKVFIAPERLKDVKQTIKNIKRNKKLAISFAPNAISKYNINELSESLGGISYDSFSIEIKLSQTKTDTVEKVYDVYENDKESFKSIKLIGKTDSGFDETIDFVETLFTHCDNFDITEDTVSNYDTIKSKLSSSLHIKQ